MAIQLNKREKFAISTMLLFGMVFIVFQFIVFPLLDERKRLDRRIQAKTQTMADLFILRNEYQEISNRAESIRASFGQREKGFTLFSFLDRLAGQAGIKDKISYMKPSTISPKDGGYKTSIVEMKMEGVTLKRLTPYLVMVEASENVVIIRRLTLSLTDKKDGFVNVVMQVEAFEA